MQNTSEQFKIAINKPHRKIRSRIKFHGLTLDENQIQTINIDSSLIFGGDFEIGTAPMNTAKVEMIVDTGDMGRNLIPNSNFSKDVLDGWASPYGTYQIKNSFNILTLTSAHEASRAQYYTDTLEPGIYTFSMLAKSEKGFRYDRIDGTEYERKDIEGSQGFKISCITFEVTEPQQVYIRMYFNNPEVGDAMEIDWVKLEKGSQATPWTPAPEDILNYDFEGKECDMEIGIELEDESIEYISTGQYTVKTANKKNNKLVLDCIDRMHKSEKDYESNLLYPATALEILQSACEQSGLELATINFANADHLVVNEPVYDFVSCRKIFAQVAELAGGYAVINRKGKLEIITLGTEAVREITKDNYINFEHNEVAVGQIDRVIVKIGEVAAEAGEGPNIYTVVDNMFVQDPTDVVDSLYNILKNVNYTACEFNWQGDPSLDLGDKVSINGLETYLLDRNMIYNGGLREDYSSPAKSNVEKESTGKGSMTIDINQIKTQIRVMEGEITQTIEKVENLVADAANRLYQSQTEIPFDLNVGTGSIQLFRDSIIPYYKVTSDTNIDLSASFPNSQFAENLAGEEVTISIDVLVDVDRIVNIDGREFNVKGNRWTRIYVTKEFAENSTKNVRIRNPFSKKISRDKVDRVNLIDSLSTDINIIYYRNLQVQKGNVATRWTQTPEELEGEITRSKTEIKQLKDSILLVATRNENTGRFEITPESIVQAIDSTDGVGRLKTTKVTVDENGLTVDNGAILIRDNNNQALITSYGLKMKYVFVSNGNRQGWQNGGLYYNDYFGIFRRGEVLLYVYIPSDFIIESAILHAKSMPYYRTNDPDGHPDGYYHVAGMRLYKADDDKDVYIWVDGHHTYDEPTIGSKTDITSSTWGSAWSPTGREIQIKSADVKEHLEVGGRSVLVMQSNLPLTHANSIYQSLVQMELEITGFLRG